MKKLVALVVALAMVLCVASALALPKIPLTMDEVPNLPAKPVMPGHVLSVVDDHYELKVNREELPKNASCSASIEGKDQNGEYRNVGLTWYEDKKAFVSTELLPSEYSDTSIYFHWYNGDGTGSQNVNLNYSISDDKVESAQVSLWRKDGNSSSYAWYDEDGTFNYNESAADDSHISVTFDTKKNKATAYSIRENDLNIGYDIYGRVDWVDKYVEGPSGSGDWFYWNEAEKAWKNGDEVLDAEPFVEANHPAPIALPYVIETVPATVDDAKNAGGELNEYEEGGAYYRGENISVSYNKKGEVSSYTVTGYDYTASYDKYGRVQSASKEIDGKYYHWDEYEKEWYRWENDGRLVAENEKPFDIAAPYAAPYENKLLANTYDGINTGVKVDDMKVPLGAVEKTESLITVADMGYDYVGINAGFVDEDGVEYDDWVELDFNEATGKWEIDAEILKKVTYYDICPSMNDVEARYSSDGSFLSSNFWNEDYDIYYNADGTIEVVSSVDNSSASYDAEGNMVRYSYSNLDGTKDVTYAVDGTLLNAYIESADGNYYFYSAKKGGWFVEVYDEVTGEWVEDVPVSESELPEDVNAEDMEPLLIVPTKPKYTWYPNNTVGVAGISLRDTYPELTKKWYNVVPVDLTQDGRQNFTLVASNLFYIGNAYVDVKGDEVTVGYELAKGHGYVKGECLQWFTSVDEITSDFLNNPEGTVAFGQTISRANDLKGQDVALLFICNTVTYRQPYTNSGVPLTRYWPNLDEWKAYRADLAELMEKLPEQAE